MADTGHKATGGTYFQAGREWYSAVYHYPIAGRSLYGVLAVLSVATLAISFMVVSSVFPISRQKEIVVFTDDVFGDVSHADKLAKPGDDLNNAIARYIIPVYVMAREYYEYNIKKLEESFSIIRQQSSNEVFAQYQKIMDPQNRASPLTRYGKNIKREIKIGRYSVDTSVSPYTAKVEFSASVNDGRRIHKNNYIADITFRFSKIQVDQITGDVFKEDIGSGEMTDLNGRLDFIVTGYKVRERVTVN